MKKVEEKGQSETRSTEAYIFRQREFVSTEGKVVRPAKDADTLALGNQGYFDRILKSVALNKLHTIYAVDSGMHHLTSSCMA